MSLKSPRLIACVTVLTVGVAGTISAARTTDGPRVPALFESTSGPGAPAWLWRSSLYDARITAAGTTYTTRGGASVRLQFVGASPQAVPRPTDDAVALAYRYVGHDPAAWQARVPLHARLRQSAAYPGIDIVSYTHGDGLEYDFEIAPGADPGAIRLAFSGGRVELQANGDLRIATASEVFHHRAPRAYQRMAGQVREVAARFVVEGHDVRFALGAYDRSQPLVIDPLVAYSTVLGTANFDRLWALGVDAAGNSYAAGSYGPADVSLFKLAPSGSVVYRVDFGGSNGDVALDLAVAADGTVTIAGITWSSDFPVLGGVQTALAGSQDVFVTRFDPAGVMVYSTYLGGSGFEQMPAVAVDAAGGTYVVGSTDSLDFPTRNPLFRDRGTQDIDLFITKLSADGSTLVYSSTVGGTSVDYGTGVAVDSTGSAYMCGWVNSTDMVVVNPLQTTHRGGVDAWVAKLAPGGGRLIYATYLGGASGEFCEDLAVDQAGGLYVTGTTESTDFPVVHAWQASRAGAEDAFLARLSPSGSALTFATYLGGSSDDEGLAVVVDRAGRATVAGSTWSSDFPQVDALYPCSGLDAFVTAFDAAGGHVRSSTCLPGIGYNRIEALAVDNAGHLYATGVTNAADFPMLPPGSTVRGKSDGFVMKFVDLVKGDMNGDEQTDILWRDPAGAIVVWLMNGTTRSASVTLAPTPALGWAVVGVDDFNRDNHNDLVLWDSSSGAVEFWLFEGTTRTVVVPLVGASLPATWRPVAAADFNLDGAPDLIFVDELTRALKIITLAGTTRLGEISPNPASSADTTWALVAARDYDTDGYTDLLWQNAVSGKVVIWFMDGSVSRTRGQFTSPASAGDNTWRMVASGDYGIGGATTATWNTQDILWRNTTSGRLVVWHMDRNGTRADGAFTTPAAPASTPPAWNVVGPR